MMLRFENNVDIGYQGFSMPVACMNDVLPTYLSIYLYLCL